MERIWRPGHRSIAERADNQREQSHARPQTGIDFSVTINEDTARTLFKPDHFARGHAFTDADNDNLKAVIITSLPITAR